MRPGRASARQPPVPDEPSGGSPASLGVQPIPRRIGRRPEGFPRYAPAESRRSPRSRRRRAQAARRPAPSRARPVPTRAEEPVTMEEAAGLLEPVGKRPPARRKEQPPAAPEPPVRTRRGRADHGVAGTKRASARRLRARAPLERAPAPAGWPGLEPITETEPEPEIAPRVEEMPEAELEPVEQLEPAPAEPTAGPGCRQRSRSELEPVSEAEAVSEPEAARISCPPARAFADVELVSAPEPMAEAAPKPAPAKSTDEVRKELRDYFSGVRERLETGRGDRRPGQSP